MDTDENFRSIQDKFPINLDYNCQGDIVSSSITSAVRQVGVVVIVSQINIL